eukprot:2351617-Pleurochrysis_carterae.AAC.1
MSQNWPHSWTREQKTMHLVHPSSSMPFARKRHLRARDGFRCTSGEDDTSSCGKDMSISVATFVLE